MERSSSSSPRRRSGRPVGDGRSRAAILDAARVLFGARGYEGASLRAIAAEAGVDPAMIRHFFTDKQGLFAATIADRTVIAERLAEAVAGDTAGLGERVAAAYLRLWGDEDTGPILHAMVRTAATSERASGILRELLSARIATGLSAELVAREDLPLRMALAGAHLLGIAIARNLARVEPLVGVDDRRLVALVAPAVQHYLTGSLPRRDAR